MWRSGGNTMKTLGVIGGLGPMATAYFMQLVIEMTEAKTDQQHIPMIIYNMPQIPDRTGFLLGVSKDNPIPPIVECGKKLETSGVYKIVIPCITAHALHELIQKEIKVPVLHIIRETALYLKERGIHTVGLEATDGTVKTGVFQKELEKQGIRVVLPNTENQQKVMDIIYKNVKASEPVNMEKFLEVEKQLKQDGADVIILGCTELSMIKRDYTLSKGYLDAMEVVAQKAVIECGILKEKYKELITI